MVGFSIDDNLNVTINNLSSARNTIDPGIRVADNNVTLNAITLSISNERSLLTEAHDHAVAKARITAGQFAQATHVHITGVVRISDQQGQLANPTPAVFRVISSEHLANST